MSRHDTTPIVKVIDFGVAKALEQDLTDKTLFTAVTQMIGTPLYMSPEQAGVSDQDVDTRSDIYSLGVLLYELLTGSTPFSEERFKKAAYDEIRRIIREEDPPKPSTRISQSTDTLPAVAANRGVEPKKLGGLMRGELDWIVMKSLEKDRNRRYETASGLARDVQRYLADEPVQACPPSTWYRFGKFTRRNRREVLIAGAAAAVAVAGVAGLAVSRTIIARALQSETKAKEDLQVEVYFQRITVAHNELMIGNLSAAKRALDECPANLREWEWYYLMRLIKDGPLVLQDSTEVYGVAWSPDGKAIASVGKDGKVKIWDIQTGRPIKKFQAHGAAARPMAARSVAFHSDGHYLATAGADGLVKVWDLTSQQAVFRGECDAIRSFGASYSVAFSPDGRLLAAGSEHAVRIWDWNEKQLPLHTLRGPEYHSIPVAFSHDGRCLATSGSPEQGLCLWDPKSERLLANLPVHPHPVTALAFSPDGRYLASASLSRIVTVWDTTSSNLLHAIPHTGNVLAVAFSANSRRLVSAGEDRTVHVWDATRLDDKQQPREVLGLLGHADMVGCVAVSPTGLASASHDKTIRIWDATPLGPDESEGTPTFRQGHEVRTLAVRPDGRFVVSAGNGPCAKVWDAATLRETFPFTGHSVTVFSVDWHPDGRRIASAGSVGRHHSIKVWDASDGQEQFPKISADRNAGPYQVVAFSPDRRYLVTGQLEGGVQVWDAQTGRKVQTRDVATGQTFDNTFATHDREIRAVVFSRKGGLLATGSGDGKVMLWDATRLDEKQKPRHVFQTRIPGPSVNVAFSPDGRLLATGGEDNTVKIWDVQTGRESCAPLKGHSKEVYAVAFSPIDEGRWVASGGEDGKVKIWDSRSGELVRTFHGHTGLVSSLAFSPDGKRLYSGSRDATVKIWDLTQSSQVARQQFRTTKEVQR